jgi:hypothetical protein
MFEKRVLRRIFRLKRNGVTGGCRKLCREEFHDLYASPSIIIMINSRSMSLSGRVAWKRKKWNLYMVLERAS